MLAGIVSFGAGFVLGGKSLAGMINDYKVKMQRNHENMMLLNDWLHFLYLGGTLEDYFRTRGYKQIMVYGNGYIGERLLQALEKTDIEVVAVMDRSVPSDRKGKVIGVDSEIPDSDCIVVTPVFYMDEIRDMLQKKTDIPVVSIQEIIKI